MLRIHENLQKFRGQFPEQTVLENMYEASLRKIFGVFKIFAAKKRGDWNVLSRIEVDTGRVLAGGRSHREGDCQSAGCRAGCIPRTFVRNLRVHCRSAYPYYSQKNWLVIGIFPIPVLAGKYQVNWGNIWVHLDVNCSSATFPRCLKITEAGRERG